MTSTRSSTSIQVLLEPAGRRIAVEPDTTILAAAQAAGIAANAVCGGQGTCGACKVLTISGTFSPPTSQETNLTLNNINKEIYRLACQTRVLSDAVVQFPPESLASRQRLQLEGDSLPGVIDPAVTRLDFSLHHTNLEKTSRIDILRDELKIEAGIHATLPRHLLSCIESLLNLHQNQISLISNGTQIITALAPKEHMLGFAADIGTTKLAAYLVDLETGQTLASTGKVNPQIAYGEDVISRIQYADDHIDGVMTLQKVVIEALNQMILELTQQTNSSPNQIVDGVLVGNTAMHHLVAGLPVHSLGTAPYHATQIDALTLKASEVGLQLPPETNLYFPPNIAGFVGADHVSMLLSSTARVSHKTTAALDIGTNTEISLIHKGRHLCCSCASGPAFEGAHIRDGIRAIPGAIERVFIDHSGIKIQTIDNLPPIGICGSGVVDAVAQMRKIGLIDSRGAFNKEHMNFASHQGIPEFKLTNCADETVHPVGITRKDVNEIQLAKAAIRSGLEILLREANISADDIDQVYIAGAFGTYLDLENCISIAMLPNIPLQKYHQIGNAAGSGARELLLSRKKRSEAEQMANQIEYIELTTVKDYVDFFTDAIAL